jgi:hypothetical protein
MCFQHLTAVPRYIAAAVAAQEKGKTLSITMVRGKRLLAGLAAGALALTGAAVVTAPQAQAAGVTSVYCSGGSTVTVPGDPGTFPDPTTVLADCSVPAGSDNLARVSASTFTPATGFVQMMISGNAVWNTAVGTWIPTEVAGGNALVSADGKTLTIAVGSLPADAPADALDATTQVTLALNSNAPGQVTVTTYVSSAADISLVNTNKSLEGTFEVAAYGAPVALQYVELLHAIPSEWTTSPQTAAVPDGLGAADNQAWVGIVLAVDSAGNPYPLNPDGVDPITTMNFVATPGVNRDTLELTAVPVPALAPFAVGVNSIGANNGADARLMGSNSFTVATLPTLPPLSVSGSYIVSSTLAGSYTATFDKAQYNRGELATLTLCANDLGGRIVPDGLDWVFTDDTQGPVNRFMDMNFNVETVVPTQELVIGSGTGFEVDSVTGVVSTVNGCVTYNVRMPGQNVDFTVTFAPLNIGPLNMAEIAPQMVTTNGWASTVSGPTSLTVKVGDGGEPTPPPPVTATIMIEGIRGSGADANRVYVEGTTTNLVGATVVPHYRFPGQVGFTAGVGLRSVDSLGNFEWKRITGKRIAVQFRTGDVRSNSIIIAAR